MLVARTTKRRLSKQICERSGLRDDNQVCCMRFSLRGDDEARCVVSDAVGSDNEDYAICCHGGGQGGEDETKDSSSINVMIRALAS